MLFRSRKNGLSTADMPHPPMFFARPAARSVARVPGPRAPGAREATPTHPSAWFVPRLLSGLPHSCYKYVADDEVIELQISCRCA